METRRTPLVNMVLKEIERRIATGVYRAGTRLPSERALAQDLAVSRITVRAAVGELERMGVVVCHPRSRPLVQAPHLVPNHRGPMQGRHTFALWLRYGWAAPEGPALMLGIQRALDHDNHRLVFGAPPDDPDMVQAERQFLQNALDDQDVAGIVLWYLGGADNVPTLERVRDAGIPMVFVDRLPPAGIDADFVGIDNEHVADRIVSHLIRKGHRRIAHVTNQDAASAVRDRATGYRKALLRAGIEPDASLEFTEVVPRYPGHDVWLEMAERMLRMPDRPTAVFAVNDRVALHLIRALEQVGCRVPSDMAVAGIDGIQAYQGESFLTTAIQPFERIGERAVHLLIERVSGDPGAPIRHCLLDAPILLGPSTGDESRIMGLHG
ncbi:MAG: GntR family transcriptional regulator [Fimbriimonadales bacterium]|nr:GntR family transcriptional regulator [Fimbriimonadales bacterium]